MSASFFSKFTIHSCAVSFFLSFIYFPRLQYHSGSGFAPLLPHGTSTQVDADSGVSPVPGAVLESFMQPWDSRQPSAKLHPFWSAFMHWNCTFQELYVSNSLNCVVEDSLEFMSVFSAHIVVLAWTLDFLIHKLRWHLLICAIYFNMWKKPELHVTSPQFFFIVNHIEGSKNVSEKYSINKIDWLCKLQKYEWGLHLFLGFYLFKQYVENSSSSIEFYIVQ